MIIPSLLATVHQVLLFIYLENQFNICQWCLLLHSDACAECAFCRPLAAGAAKNPSCWLLSNHILWVDQLFNDLFVFFPQLPSTLDLKFGSDLGDLQ